MVSDLGLLQVRQDEQNIQAQLPFGLRKHMSKHCRSRLQVVLWSRHMQNIFSSFLDAKGDNWRNTGLILSLAASDCAGTWANCPLSAFRLALTCLRGLLSCLRRLQRQKTGSLCRCELRNVAQSVAQNKLVHAVQAVASVEHDNNTCPETVTAAPQPRNCIIRCCGPV